MLKDVCQHNRGHVPAVIVDLFSHGCLWAAAPTAQLMFDGPICAGRCGYGDVRKAWDFTPAARVGILLVVFLEVNATGRYSSVHVLMES